MITYYRPPTRTTISQNIAHVKRRYNPTNTHTQLWTKQPPSHAPTTRFTPTFSSNIFHNSCLAQEQNQNTISKDNIDSNNRSVIYENNSKQKRQVSLNPTLNMQDFKGKGIQYFNDIQKYAKFRNLDITSTKYCRNRKILDLSSNPLRHEQATDIEYRKKIPQDIFLPRRQAN